MSIFLRFSLADQAKFVRLLLACWCLPIASVQAQEWVNETEARRSTRPDTILYLDLSGQQLKKVPAYVYRFTQLKALNLSRNQLRKVPARLNRLDSLRLLEVSENGVADRKQKIRELYNAYYHSDLAIVGDVNKNPAYFMNKTRMDSAYQALREAVSRVEEAQNPLVLRFDRCRNLRDLGLSESALPHLHRSIRRLKKLEQLNLSKNLLSFISKDLAGLRHLKNLNLNFNRIDLTKSWLDGFAALGKLSLASNGIAVLPPGMAGWKQLTGLTLSRNQIQRLDFDIGQLTRLTLLNLYDNQLADMTPPVCPLQPGGAGPYL